MTIPPRRFASPPKGATLVVRQSRPDGGMTIPPRRFASPPKGATLVVRQSRPDGVLGSSCLRFAPSAPLSRSSIGGGAIS
jgi:hypothetical protein